MGSLKEPRAVQLSAIFANNEQKRYEIPHYQRSYVWGKDQIESLWNDFMHEPPHGGLNLLGTIIVCESSADKKMLQIVDGQQRLISCSLMLTALKDVWKEVSGENGDFYTYLKQQLYETDPYTGHFSMRLNVGSDIKTSYEDLVYKSIKPPRVNSKDKPLFQAYDLFREKLAEKISSAKLTQNDKELILKNLHQRLFGVNIILIQLEDEADAYEVFESFNAKGIELKVAELLKNLFLSKISDANIERSLRKWREIEANISSVNLSKFNMSTYLRYFWIAEHPYVTERELYRSIKATNPDYEKLLNDLHRTSQQIKNAFGEDLEKIKLDYNFADRRHALNFSKSIRGIRTMKTQSFIVWLIALNRNHIATISSKWVMTSVDQIEKFTFHYFAIGNNPANRIEKYFSKRSNRLRDAVKNQDESALQTIVLSDFAQYIKKNALLDNFAQFKADFMKLKKKQSNGDFIKYLFVKLEDSIRDTNEVAVDEVNIEHLLPQNPSDEWDVTSTDIKDYVDSLGNLTILDFRINSSIKNASFEKKIMGDSKTKGISKSDLELNKQMIESLDAYKWTKQEITDRQEQLAKLCYENWKIS
ncbi:MAG TPA: DUF262 domain-containing HNH endonuclease family protein [Candidatus Saccharimonadales bacterium]|jgi:hypothetical protein